MDHSTAVRYRCFESLQSGQYCVQSADFYRLPLDKEQVSNLDSRFVELFIEQDPVKRAREYPTLKGAVAAHEKDFS